MTPAPLYRNQQGNSRRDRNISEENLGPELEIRISTTVQICSFFFQPFPLVLVYISFSLLF